MDWYQVTVRDPVFLSELKQMTFEYLQSFGEVQASEIITANDLHPIYESQIRNFIESWKLNKGA